MQRHLSIAASVLALAAINTPAWAATPRQLYGKSVLISYTTTQMARTAGTNEPFHAQTFQKQLSVYISTAGRPFLRNTTTNRSGTGSIEQVGASGSTQLGQPSSVQFRGQSLVITFVFLSGAIHVQADFGPDFTSCTTNVIRGIGTGNKTMTVKSLTGGIFEVQSSTTTGATCTIRDGNVFAD
jgi:hypothetical protein